MKIKKLAITCIVIWYVVLLLAFAGCSTGQENRAADATSKVESAKEHSREEHTFGKPKYTSLEELNGKTIAMLIGSPFEEQIRSNIPNVKAVTYFANIVDMLLALKSGRIDACFLNNATAELAVNREPSLAIFPKPLGKTSFGIAFAKGDARYHDWQTAYHSISEDQKNALWKKWTGADDAAKSLPAQDWPGNNGIVTVAVCDTMEPMSYACEGGEIIGFDIEMILLLAKNLDVHVHWEGSESAAVLSAVQSGKADLGAGAIEVTDERKQSMNFVEYYPLSYVLTMRSAEEHTNAASFFSKIRESFENTFIREQRWQLFVRGIKTTLLIAAISVLLGSILGFFAYIACRNGNPLVNRVINFIIGLVQGMPMVVLLMILYYIIFGSVEISGTLVAIIGFSIAFAASVFGMLSNGVSTVNIGQMEAASALGYENSRAFYRIIFPQAVPYILPIYLTEISGLIKATSIVGYISVQDLTQIGDLIRSRTYDAFFPLIAVSVVYFLLTAVLTFFVKQLSTRFEWKKRRKHEILKGVNWHD